MRAGVGRLGAPRQNAEVPDLDLVRGGAPLDAVERFELAYSDEAGEQRVSLAHAGSVLFEDCRPVRDFPS